MNRHLKTLVFALLAFASALLLSHKFDVAVVAAAVVGIGTYLTWWPRNAYVDYAVSGSMFSLIGIAVITRGDWLPGILVFLVAIGCGLRANSEWKREHSKRQLSTHCCHYVRCYAQRSTWRRREQIKGACALRGDHRVDGDLRNCSW